MDGLKELLRCFSLIRHRIESGTMVWQKNSNPEQSILLHYSMSLESSIPYRLGSFSDLLEQGRAKAAKNVNFGFAYVSDFTKNAPCLESVRL
jgi:hypothetical protein